jgi:4'-phosphopantetheinyl transferase
MGDEAWITDITFVNQRMPLGNLSAPESPVVHLWYLDLGRLWHSLSSALGGEEAKSEAGQGEMTMPQLRVARRFYLRMLLGAYLGLPGKDVILYRGVRGKPVLDRTRHPRNLHFSLAKSGQRLLIGVSGSNEVGVDLEIKDRKPRKVCELASRFFSAAEARLIASSESQRDAVFMRTWACKEAVAKASGHGIANRFCRFSVDASENRPPVVLLDEDHPAEEWQLGLMVPEPGYLAAVAVRQPGLRVEAFRI